MLEAARQALGGATRVLVVTGAGISAESGIPTFRGEGGLWEGFRAQDLATPQAFARDPELVWRWYRWRRDICNRAQPNPGHLAVARLEQTHDSLLLTQNVDGLHPRAGSERLVEIHGNIDTARCTACWTLTPIAELDDGVPRCPRCAGTMRPHILWFGETYWEGTLDVGLAFAGRADVCLVVGTSGMVTAPTSVAMHAKRSGAFVIDVNPNTSEVTRFADAWLKGPSGELLPELIGAD
ncbi:MAG: NAD-dependent deacylase [Proteobacteria bacterium]|nr:NAD-dependent deacylase [Pseudomonadota bacterium]MCP4916614.1 NAD-dependent deacylase [Pseudomonadota bacterium]